MSRDPLADEEARLAALADGTRDPELEARVAESSDLAALLAEQTRAVALLRGAAEEVGAPASLRSRVNELRQPKRAARRSPFVWAGAAATAAAAAALGVVIFTGGGASPLFRSNLEPASAALGSGGTASFTKTRSGWRIDLDAGGLPRLEGGRFYEAWLKDANGVLVPIGTFNEGRDVTLWASVSPKDFTVITVTREQADGDQASSGDRVLAGPIVATG